MEVTVFDSFFSLGVYMIHKFWLTINSQLPFRTGNRVAWQMKHIDDCKRFYKKHNCKGEREAALV
jgi:hypothetical protein